MNNEYQGNYQNNNYQGTPQNATGENKGSFGWAVLGFLFPLVGLILFLVWKDKKPGDSKKAGIGALVGFICGILFSILISVVLPLLMWGSIKSSVADTSCQSLYGENYKAEQVGSTWYCVDSITGEKQQLQ